MEREHEDHEADISDNESGLSSDTINANYKSKSVSFHLSNVRLVDSLAIVDDLDRESTLLSSDITKEESIEKLKNIDYSEYYKNTIQTDNFSDYEEIRDDDVTPREGRKSLQAPSPSVLDRFSSKLTIDFDIEEFEEIRDDDSFDNDVYKDSKIFQEFPWEYGKRITDIGATKRRTELIDRTASMLERRLKMIGRFKEIFEERKFIKMKNSYLNRKCCQYYEKSTTDGPFESLEGALPIYVDERYQNILDDFMVIQDHYETSKPILENEIKKLTNSYEILSRMFDETFGEFIRREWEIVTNLIEDKADKLQRKFHHLTKKQRVKINELSKVRVSYLELNHRLAFINLNLQKLNDIGEGRTLMDYEQLLIVHDALLDKMDERNEELGKLKEKCSQDIASVSHMKESSDILIYEMLNATSALNETTEMKKEERGLLAVGKTRRDALRKTIISSTSRHVGRIIENPALLRKMCDDTRILELLKLRIKKLVAHDPVSIDADNVFMSAKKSIIRPL